MKPVIDFHCGTGIKSKTLRAMPSAVHHVFFAVCFTAMTFCCHTAQASFRKDTIEINRILHDIKTHYLSHDEHPDSLFRVILRKSERIGYEHGMQKAHRFMAGYYRDLGQYEDAVNHLTQSLELVSSTNYEEQVLTLSDLAEVYRKLQNYDLTLRYLNKVKEVLDEHPDPKRLGIYHLDFANYYISQADTISPLTDSAKNHLNIALDIFQNIQNNNLIATCFISMGNLEKHLANYNGAIEFYRQAIIRYAKEDRKSSLGFCYQNMAVNFWNLNQYDSAIPYYHLAYAIGSENNNLSLKYAATNDLSGVYGELGNMDSTLFYLKLSNGLEGELYNLAKLKVVREITEKYNFEKAARSYQAQRRNYLIAGLFMLLILAMLAMRYAIVWRSRKKITAEKMRSDKLLLNILPAKIAEELKQTGTTTPEFYPTATILFADIENFTTMSETLPATELIALLDDYFKCFDEVVLRFELEKIKTIGDAYMAASGVPEFSPRHAQNAVTAAIELQHHIGELNKSRMESGKQTVLFRIGIHSGPVIAGVVGQQKFQYDIWGDAVNMAARMEETGAAGKINISSATYKLLDQNDFIFEHRGKIPAKNKGEIEMYFVSSNLYSSKNERQLKNGKYSKFQKEFSKRLLDGLDKQLTYHGFHHVQDVMNAASVIGEGEKLSDKDWELLKTAILLHDSGFMHGYDNHEERSCVIAQDILPDFGYTQKDIDVIQGMIRATKIPQMPNTLMEKIIADADLEYLGTDRFDEISETLFQEWQNKDLMHDRDVWNQTQVKFISAHTYFTDFCIRHREHKKQENLNKIKRLIGA